MVACLLMASCSGRQVSEEELLRSINTTPMLYTVQCVAQTAVIERSSPAMSLLGQRTAIIPVEANIKAGIDLSQLKNIRISGKTVYITLPDPVIEIESTRILMKLYQKAGMGALVGKVAMNRNCPDALCEDVEAAVEGNEQLIAEFNQPDALVRPIITPRFVPSCTPELLKACGKLAAKYQLPVQSHLSENTSEIAWVAELEKESTSYGDAYNRYGLFGQTPTIMAHCVWTNGSELELMKRNCVMVAHCPTSNFNLSSGLAPVRTFLDEDLPIGLGSDISGGHDLNMFRMLVYAIQVSKMHYQHDKSKAFLTLPEIFWIATKSAGSFFGKVGSFEPGYDFDALVIDDTVLYPAEYSLLHRLERFIYLGDDRQIVARYCQGRLIPDPMDITLV